MSDSTLTGVQIADAGLDGWAHLAGRLHTRIRTPDFAAGLRLVDAIGDAAERANHHPDIDLQYAQVGVRTSSHDVGGVTERDLALARTISSLASEAGFQTDASGVAVVELGLDTPDFERVLPFWSAALAEERAEPGADEIKDPAGALPVVWFQRSGDEEGRQRWHPDVWLDPSQVPSRIEAMIEAGGTLVTDEYAPSFWVLADPEGNKVCLCTWQERG